MILSLVSLIMHMINILPKRVTSITASIYINSLDTTVIIHSFQREGLVAGYNVAKQFKKAEKFMKKFNDKVGEVFWQL